MNQFSKFLGNFSNPLTSLKEHCIVSTYLITIQNVHYQFNALYSIFFLDITIKSMKKITAKINFPSKLFSILEDFLGLLSLFFFGKCIFNKVVIFRYLRLEVTSRTNEVWLVSNILLDKVPDPKFISSKI